MSPFLFFLLGLFYSTLSQEFDFYVEANATNLTNYVNESFFFTSSYCSITSFPENNNISKPLDFWLSWNLGSLLTRESVMSDIYQPSLKQYTDKNDAIFDNLPFNVVDASKYGGQFRQCTSPITGDILFCYLFQLNPGFSPKSVSCSIFYNHLNGTKSKWVSYGKISGQSSNVFNLDVICFQDVYLISYSRDSNANRFGYTIMDLSGNFIQLDSTYTFKYTESSSNLTNAQRQWKYFYTTPTNLTYSVSNKYPIFLIEFTSYLQGDKNQGTDQCILQSIHAYYDYTSNTVNYLYNTSQNMSQLYVIGDSGYVNLPRPYSLDVNNDAGDYDVDCCYIIPFVLNGGSCSSPSACPLYLLVLDNSGKTIITSEHKIVGCATSVQIIDLTTLDNYDQNGTFFMVLYTECIDNDNVPAIGGTLGHLYPNTESSTGYTLYFYPQEYGFALVPIQNEEDSMISFCAYLLDVRDTLMISWLYGPSGNVAINDTFIAQVQTWSVYYNGTNDDEEVTRLTK